MGYEQVCFALTFSFRFLNFTVILLQILVHSKELVLLIMMVQLFGQNVYLRWNYVIKLLAFHRLLQRNFWTIMRCWLHCMGNIPGMGIQVTYVSAQPEEHQSSLVLPSRDYLLSLY